MSQNSSHSTWVGITISLISVAISTVSLAFSGLAFYYSNIMVTHGLSLTIDDESKDWAAGKPITDFGTAPLQFRFVLSNTGNRPEVVLKAVLTLKNIVNSASPQPLVIKPGEAVPIDVSMDRNNTKININAFKQEKVDLGFSVRAVMPDGTVSTQFLKIGQIKNLPVEGEGPPKFELDLDSAKQFFQIIS